MKKMPRLVHPSPPFHLPRHRKATTRKHDRQHLLKGVRQLLIQVLAALLPLSRAKIREVGPTFT
ncbi:MAG: hypothetical protein NVSMB27_30590 [Ktedonobacteraceae bacterium]